MPDSENLSYNHDFKSELNSILDKIQEKVNVGKSIETVFFEVLNDMAGYFRSIKFIKYINIFNNVGANEIGNVEFYADFIHTDKGTKKVIAPGKKLITNKRSEIDIGKGNRLFEKSMLTIGKLLRKNREFGESYEYIRITKKHARLEKNWDYFSIRYFFSQSDREYYEHNGINVFFKKEPEAQKHFEDWLHNLNTCYDANDNGVTNFIFFIGPTYYGRNDSLEQELEKYVVSANIGIANTGQKQTILSFLKYFGVFIRQISYNLSKDIDNYQKRYSSVKASIAQVMARNMSHNLSSHVLSNLIRDGVYEKLRDEEINKTLNSFVSDKEICCEGKNLQLPFFFQYLKNRMDYLSEVTFSVSNMLTTKMMYRDVLMELDRVRILLNYISGIAEFKYRIEAYYNGINLKTNDIGVSFVSDILGCQAFYNIIENVIRNTAKHANNKDGITTFTINFKDIYNCYAVKSVDEYYCVEIDNGVIEDRIEELVKQQNRRLNESILDEHYELRDHNLGLLEMEASAAFLRQIDLPEIESDNYYIDDNNNYYHERDGIKRLNIIKAFKTDKGALGYRFFIKKPKEFLFIGNWKGIGEDRQKRLVNYGVQFLSEGEFDKSMDEKTSFSHRFVIYRDDIANDVKDKLSEDNDCKTLLPIRKLCVSSNEAKEIMDKINRNHDKNIVGLLNEFAWTHYYDKSGGVIVGANVNRSKTSVCDQLIFLNHANNGSHSGTVGLKSENHELWVENLSSYTMSKLPSFAELSTIREGRRETQLQAYLNNIQENKQIKSELLEAYRNKVLVLDERIQKFSIESTEGSSNRLSGPIPCSALYASTNVLIPKTPLDPTNFEDNAIADLVTFVKNNINGSFVLVHYGVLERIYKDENIILDQLKEWSAVAKRVVITSGRGSHSLPLPTSVCYANLSSVLSAFCFNRNKLLINNLINQSRRKHE